MDIININEAEQVVYHLIPNPINGARFEWYRIETRAMRDSGNPDRPDHVLIRSKSERAEWKSGRHGKPIGKIFYAVYGVYSDDGHPGTCLHISDRVDLKSARDLLEDMGVIVPEGQAQDEQLTSLNRRALATVLGSLRFAQVIPLDVHCQELQDVFTDCGDLEPLSEDEVDDLCEWLNTTTTQLENRERYATN